MLFFDINKLEELSCNDPKLLLSILLKHWDKNASVSRKINALFERISLTGNSYLLNPKDLFNDQRTDDLFKTQYIKLAGRRDYGLYKLYKYAGLQTSFYPDLIYDSIKHNPLLVIKQNEILFTHEERYKTNGTRI